MKGFMYTAIIGLSILNTSIAAKSEISPVTKMVAKAGIVYAGYRLQRAWGRQEHPLLFVAVFVIGVMIRN